MAQELTDEILIEKIRKDCDSDAFMELENRHNGLFATIVKKYAPNLLQVSGVCFQDVMERKSDLLYQAVLDYDKEKSQFNTWFGNKVDFYCKNVLNITNKLRKFEPMKSESLESFLDTVVYYEPDPSYTEEINLVFDVLNKHSDKRLAKIFYMKFFLPKPQNSFNNIAKSLGLSVQGCINLYNKGKRYLQKHHTLNQWIKE